MVTMHLSGTVIGILSLEDDGIIKLLHQQTLLQQ